MNYDALAITIGSRWDNVLGERVVVYARPGGRVSFLRAGAKRVDQQDETEFLSGFKLVDETEEAKKLKTSILITTYEDYWSLRVAARNGNGDALRRLDRLRVRFEAAEAELDARVPPRST